MSFPHPLGPLIAWADDQLAAYIYTGAENKPSNGRSQAGQVMAVLTWTVERGMPASSWPQRHRSLVDSYQHWPPALLQWAQDIIAAQPGSAQRDFCWGVVSAMIADPPGWAVPLGVSNLAFRKMVGR